MGLLKHLLQPLGYTDAFQTFVERATDAQLMALLREERAAGRFEECVIIAKQLAMREISFDFVTASNKKVMRCAWRKPS